MLYQAQKQQQQQQQPQKRVCKKKNNIDEFLRNIFSSILNVVGVVKQPFHNQTPQLAFFVGVFVVIVRFIFETGFVYFTTTISSQLKDRQSLHGLKKELIIKQKKKRS